jgi:hypothetical protein
LTKPQSCNITHKAVSERLENRQFCHLFFVRFPSKRNEKLFCFMSYINADVVDILPSLYGLNTRIDQPAAAYHRAIPSPIP